MNRFRGLATAVTVLSFLPIHRSGMAAEANVPASNSPSEAKNAFAFFEAGSQAYLKGDYRAAVEAFTWSYRISQRPGLLFSLAQTNWRAFLGNNDPSYLRRAMSCYRGYLSAQPHGPRRKEAERALEVLLPLEARLAPSELAPLTCIESFPPTTPSAPSTPLSESNDTKRSDGTWLMVSSNSSKAVITLDEHNAGEMPYIEQVSPGQHVLKVTAEGYEPATKRVVVPEGAALAVTFDLKEVPARLKVFAPEGAEIFIDGEHRGDAPSFFAPVASGEHHLAVRMRGRKLETRRLVLEPGKPYQLSVPLKTTFARHWAQGLALAGVAAGLSTAVFTGFAYERQARADALFEKHERGDLTPQERDTYARVVDQRDDLRTFAWASGIGTVALGSAALLLWFFEPLPVIERFEPAAPLPSHGPDWSAALSFDRQHWSASAMARF